MDAEIIERTRNFRSEEEIPCEDWISFVIKEGRSQSATSGPERYCKIRYKMRVDTTPSEGIELGINAEKPKRRS